jgi:hypothetical protein
MKFGQYIKNQMVPEWYLLYLRIDAYIDYQFLKYLIKPFGKFKKNYIFIHYEDSNSIQISNSKIEYFD